MLYAASNIDYCKFLPEAKVRDGGFYVQGTDTAPSFPLRCNIFLFPIDPSAFPKIRPVQGPIASGHSCDGAIWLVQLGKFSGVLPFAVTGSVLGDHLVENDYFNRKQEYCRLVRVPMAANSEGADIPLEDLSAVAGVNLRDLPRYSAN